MFRKFSSEESSNKQQLKTSVVRGIRSSILEQYPLLEPHLDNIIPKKAQLVMVKLPEHVNLILCENEPLFFQTRDGPIAPTLRILHKYPFMMPKMQCDRGAIRFVLSGANIMCPGLTSPGGKMDEVPAGAIVAIMAEGKEHAMAIGLTKLSSAEIASVNKGIGIDNLHHLGDGLWTTPMLN
eukprot:GILI01004818.1.p1 GENE.GILI01004818.1~~GILI01004818.1.p1  ORF type:complete len:181 (+),score=54.22 GILI01004818.1:72-614(+)